ncbi:phenylacetate--CoA ligase family protein [Immundisolibacter sp.]|uniref:phenylacetate--CoA ligase family protein n=1 Tax=Immundisolibacter sp. TaxID=1934948 RepID=UPI0035648124
MTDPPSPRSAVAGLLWPALPDSAGASLLALHYQLAQSEWWSPVQLAASGRRQLGALLRHARDTVPAYGERLAGLPLDQGDALAPAWSELPLLQRADVQDLGEALRSRAVPADHGQLIEYHTSGSTGRPLHGYETELSHFFFGALNLREHLWQRRDFAGCFAAIRTQVTDNRLEGWGRAVEAVFATGPAVTLPIHTPIAQQLDWLLAKDPDYLLTHPSNLRGLLLEARVRGARPARLRGLGSFGEALADDLRGLCQDVWGLPLADIYSCEEAGYIALQCPQVPEHYHVQAENLLVEILDSAGQPCAPGVTGQVVLTTLHNFAMPLVRYAIGDYAELGPPCACGRGLPVLRRIRGRQRNLLRFPDGSQHWPSFPADAWLAIAPVRQFRLRQTALKRIEVELVTAQPLTQPQETALRQMLQQRLGYPFVIVLQRLEQLPVAANGKFEDFVCEMGT